MYCEHLIFIATSVLPVPCPYNALMNLSRGFTAEMFYRMCNFIWNVHDIVSSVQSEQESVINETWMPINVAMVTKK